LVEYARLASDIRRNLMERAMQEEEKLGLGNSKSRERHEKI